MNMSDKDLIKDKIKNIKEEKDLDDILTEIFKVKRQKNWWIWWWWVK